jgi:hypothetical protein
MTKISEAIKVIDSSSIKRKKKLEDAAEDMAIALRKALPFLEYLYKHKEEEPISRELDVYSENILLELIDEIIGLENESYKDWITKNK